MATEQESSHNPISEAGADVALKANKAKPWDPLKSQDWDEQEYTAIALTRIKRLRLPATAIFNSLYLSVFIFLISSVSVET